MVDLSPVAPATASAPAPATASAPAPATAPAPAPATAPAPAPSRRRVEAVALLLLPCLLAAPLLGGGGGGTAAAALYASIAAASGLLHGPLVLPEALARDVGLYLLGVHLLLQVCAGFAVRRLLERVGLRGAATAGALLFVLSPPFLPGGLAGGGAALGLSAALLLLAVERCAAPHFPGEGGALRLAGVIVAVGMFGDPTGLEADGALGLFWAAARLGAAPPGGRARAAWRLGGGALGGLLVAVPLNAVLNGVAGTAGLADARSAAESLGAWLGLLSPPAWTLAELARQAAPTLPLLAVAVLGARRQGDGAPLRAALAAAGLLSAAMLIGRARVIAADAAPTLFLAAAALAAVATRDAGRGTPARRPIRVAAGIATAAAAAAIATFLPPLRYLVLGEAVAAWLALLLAEHAGAMFFLVLLGIAAGYEFSIVASVLRP